MRIRTFAVCILLCTIATPFLLPRQQVQPQKAADALAAPHVIATPPVPTTTEPVRRNIRNVTPPGILQAPSIETDTIARLPAKLAPKPPPRPLEPVLLSRPIIFVAGVLKSGNTTVRIAGIDPLAFDASCVAANGPPWPCGAFAKTAFQRFIRQRTIACEPTVSLNSQQETVTSCTVGGVDLATWLIEGGWAMPADPLDHQEALAGARADRRGQWGDRPQLD